MQAFPSAINRFSIFKTLIFHLRYKSSSDLSVIKLFSNSHRLPKVYSRNIFWRFMCKQEHYIYMILPVTFIFKSITIIMPDINKIHSCMTNATLVVKSFCTLWTSPNKAFGFIVKVFDQMVKVTIKIIL